MRLKTWSLLLFFSISLSQPETPYVLLISFDGFRADYLDWYDTPNFDAFSRGGIKTNGMEPVFVTKTFPNHYSIATGMYIENHGLIDNYFYDEKLDDFYTLGDRTKVEDARFYGGEPIWVTAEKQGIHAASMFWVGSEAAVGSVQPSIWKKYDHYMPFGSRIDTVVSWFSLPENRRPRLVTLYFHEPDDTGHKTGVSSLETQNLIVKLDSLFGVIITKTASLDIAKNLNIIVVSDHGMTDISMDRVIQLGDHIDMEGMTQERSGPFSFLYNLSQERAEKIVPILNDVPHLSAYLKKDIPGRYRFKNHYRIKQVLLVADEGWSILEEARVHDPEHLKYTATGATHGYDNKLRSMQAIFLADGPAFRDGYYRESILNIQVYPMIAHILGLTPNPEADGKIKDVQDLFKE